MALVISLIVVGIVIWQVNLRNGELFFLSVRNSRLLLVRGRAPGRLIREFRDVIEREGLERGSIRAVVGPNGARLDVRQTGEDAAQRLRNVFGLHDVSKLRRAPPPNHRNVGQLLGIAALAWWFEGH